MRPLAEVAVPAWVSEAACAQVGGDMWFPEVGVNGTTIAKVKAMCAACPVRAQCLDYAVDTESWWGVFGGLSVRERRKYARERGREAA